MPGMGSQPRLLARLSRQKRLIANFQSIRSRIHQPITWRSQIQLALTRADVRGVGRAAFTRRSERLNRASTVAEDTLAYILVERHGLDTKGLNTGIIGTSQLKWRAGHIIID